MLRCSWAIKIIPLLGAVALPSLTQNGGNLFTNFEAALTSPIRLSADGTRLYCVNNPNSTLSVFDVSTDPANPALIAEIPVGVEPVSVNPRTDDEVWVVNEESDSVNVVSVSKQVVTDTIQAADEPSDVVFAGEYAFVSAARNNLILVYDVNTHKQVKSISVFGGGPRQMTVSPDGNTVYAAFALSGNQTTLIPAQVAPAPPPPVNQALPPAPQQGIIVTATDPAWTGVVKWTMPDNDVVAINASTLQIANYYSGVGTVNLGIAVQPSTGNLFVTNTDALNLIRFQTNLDGHFVNNRVSKITPSGTVTAYDLNPTVNYTGLPDPGSLAVALAQPSGIVFDAAGQTMYIAAFGTDRVAQVDTGGNVLARIEIDPAATGATVAPRTKRGPRGLAMNSGANKLYVMNRLTDTISVIDTTANTVTSEIPAGSNNPTPTTIRNGRGYLYDAKLSGSGTGSCASCHIDGEADHLSWDLGDPTGNMFPVTLADGTVYEEHPMKGPMVTSTLRGLVNQQPYHWRGDKPQFTDFNVAFQELMGGNQVADDEMADFTSFINTITWMPNPYQNLDRTYPTNLEGGNAARGQQEFSSVIINPNQKTCNGCHAAANYGSNLQILILGSENQPMKNTPLRVSYQKQLFSKTGQTIDGFGMLHDGGEENIHTFLASRNFPEISNNTRVQNDLSAFNLSMDTGTAPAAGASVTLTSSNVLNATNTSRWTTIESQAAAQNCDLIIDAFFQSARLTLLYNPSNATYTSALPGYGPYTHSQVVKSIEAGGIATVIGVPYGSGSRMIVRVSNGKLAAVKK